jgi:hypothetical protein
MEDCSNAGSTTDKIKFDMWLGAGIFGVLAEKVPLLSVYRESRVIAKKFYKAFTDNRSIQSQFRAQIRPSIDILFLSEKLCNDCDIRPGDCFFGQMVQALPASNLNDLCH